MKKHYKAYASGFDGAKELRAKLMKTNSAKEAEKIVKKPSESLSALQVDLKSLISRMETRLRTLKKSGY